MRSSDNDRLAVGKVWSTGTPIVITLCCIMSMLIVFVLDFDDRIFWVTIINDNELQYYGVLLTFWKRCALIVLSILCILPYLLNHEKINSSFFSGEWMKLGLVVGMTFLLMALAALPSSSFTIDGFDYARMKNATSQEVVYLFDAFLDNRVILNGAQQNRLFITSAQSILFPLSLYILTHLFNEWKASRNYVYVVAILFIVIGIRYLDPTILYPIEIYKTVACISIAISLDCSVQLFAKDRISYPETHCISVGCHLLTYGIQLILFYFNIVIMFILELLGKYEKGGLFSYYEIIITIILSLGILYTIILNFAHHEKSKYAMMGKILPLYILMWTGFVINYIGWLKIDATLILQKFEEYALDSHFYSVPFKNILNLGFYASAPYALYTMWFLCDYGFEKKQGLFLALYLALIISMYIPDLKICEKHGVSTVSVINIIIGLTASILVIVFGLYENKLNHSQASRHNN